jgi:hypothetical protein
MIKKENHLVAVKTHSVPEWTIEKMICNLISLHFLGFKFFI